MRLLACPADSVPHMPVLAAVGSLITTLLGGWAAPRIADHSHLILGLAAGLMLGVVCFDLIPEALAHESHRLLGVPAALLALAAGFLALHVLERSAARHRGHEDEYSDRSHEPGIGILAASGLVGHSVIDGFAIGAAFQAGAAVGGGDRRRVISHDFADGFTTFTITTLFGNNRQHGPPRIRQ